MSRHHLDLGDAYLDLSSHPNVKITNRGHLPLICAVVDGCRLGQASTIWSRWSQREAPHGVATQPESPISRWMSSSVIGLSPR
jgi:hypothetical protein